MQDTKASKSANDFPVGTLVKCDHAMQLPQDENKLHEEKHIDIEDGTSNMLCIVLSRSFLPDMFQNMDNIVPILLLGEVWASPVFWLKKI